MHKGKWGMTNEEILKKAIKQAENNGYNFPFSWEALNLSDTLLGEYRWYPSIIFSHSFAKAFWKKDVIIKGTGTIYDWCYYLQQMVLEEEPLKYLERFL